MPKRKAAAVQETASGDSPAKKGKAEASSSSVKKRGRPPLSAEEKAKRDAKKDATKVAGRGRGRPKGSSFSRHWLAFSPWIRKPMAFANSPPVMDKKSASFAEPKPDGDNSDISSSNSSSGSNHTDAEDESSSGKMRGRPPLSPEASSRLDRDDEETGDKSFVVPSAIKAVTPKLSTPIMHKDVPKSFSHVNNNKAKVNNNRKESLKAAPLSTEQLDVLKLEKEKLTIEIEVLHLKKKKLILQLEKMAHSSTPFIP